MYYAADHHYDVRFANDFATLYRFATKADRDRFVDDRQWEEARSGNIRTEPVSRDEARRKFPSAFKVESHRELLLDSGIGWFEDHEGNEYWGEEADCLCESPAW